MKLKKKAVISIYISFFFIMILIVLLAAVVAPIGVLFNSKMYLAGEQIMLIANDSIANISNTEVRDDILDIVDQGFKAQETNIEVNAQIYQYGWVIVVILVFLIIFLFTRRTVEVTQGGLF